MNPFLIEQMAMYSAYHRDRRNRATHFVGIPAIAFAILVPLAMVPLTAIGGYTVTLAGLFVVAVLVLYAWMDKALALGAALVYLPILLAAEWVAGMGPAIAWTVFAVAFTGGWVFQLVGHAIEGRRPALADNLFQVLVAPIFLMAEVYFALGWKRELHDAMEARWIRYRAGMGEPHSRARGA